jgi:hypothetical protein
MPQTGCPVCGYPRFIELHPSQPPISLSCRSRSH